MADELIELGGEEQRGRAVGQVEASELVEADDARRHAGQHGLGEAAALIEQATIVIRETQIGFLEKAPVGTRSAVEELITYRTVLRTTAEAATKSALQIDGMRQASLALKGVSGELNEASTNLFSVLSALIEKIERYSEMAREIDFLREDPIDPYDSMGVALRSP